MSAFIYSLLMCYLTIFFAELQSLYSAPLLSTSGSSSASGPCKTCDPVPSSSASSIPQMEMYIRGLQDTICGHLEKIEAENPSPACSPQYGKPGKTFLRDEMVRDSKTGMGGGGIVRVMQDGAVFEKAGVNISVIHGKMPANRLAHMRADHKELAQYISTIQDPKHTMLPFSVAGLSLVLHPHNPMVPTVHANYRMCKCFASCFNALF